MFDQIILCVELKCLSLVRKRYCACVENIVISPGYLLKYIREAVKLRMRSRDDGIFPVEIIHDCIIFKTSGIIFKRQCS
jgi:hypothetical protein